MPAGGYKFELLPPELKGEWLRLVAHDANVVTAYLHQRQPPRYAPDANAEFFRGLARVGETGATWCPALLRPAAHNRNLMVLAKSGSTEVYAEVDEKIAFQVLDDAKRAEEVRMICAVKPEFSVDAASVIIRNGPQTLRLPKGPAAFDQPPVPLRAIREVESERNLANIHGTFYEIPREKTSWHKLRPIASHDRLITDFCTWRGLLVLAGARTDAAATPNFFKSADGKLGLWCGAIDDLWKLGKPVGVGGPWKHTAVKGGKPSDAYLMTGYDQKRVLLSHGATKTVEFKVEVDVANEGFWKTYATLKVEPGQTLEHKFPDAYGAHWVRLTTDADCTASAEFHYE